MPNAWVKVASVDDVKVGTPVKVDVNGQELAVYNVDGKFYCTSNICPHQGGPLHEGMMEGTGVVCPWHAWVFDVSTGTSPVNPRAKIPCYPVKVEGKDLLVGI
jgi:nitrite reductase/ring-hydroxylating ferredoxin subunit